MAMDNGEPLSTHDRDLIELTSAQGRPLDTSWARILLAQIDHLRGIAETMRNMVTQANRAGGRAVPQLRLHVRRGGVARMTFREYFKERNGLDYPARDGEPFMDVMVRLTETFADYVDRVAPDGKPRASDVGWGADIRVRERGTKQ